MHRLNGKVALVTGAGQGLGEAIARRFAAEGAVLVLADINEDAIRALAQELPDASAMVLDVTSESDWNKLAEAIQAEHGKLDILVNNAGIFRLSALRDTSLEQYMAVINTNQTGCFLGMRAAAMVMGEGGSIVNISSTQGLEGLRGGTAYVASKFAIRGMTKVAALELAASGIRVNSVHPGAMATTMMQAGLDSIAEATPEHSPLDDLPISRAADPTEIANLVLFLASDEASYCTGSEYVADGGMLAGPTY